MIDLLAVDWPVWAAVAGFALPLIWCVRLEIKLRRTKRDLEVTFECADTANLEGLKQLGNRLDQLAQSVCVIQGERIAAVETDLASLIKHERGKAAKVKKILRRKK